VENSLFYWKGAEGKEVDFVFRIRDRFLPVEIKYQSSISTGDIQGLISFRNLCPSFKGLLLTKDKFDDSMSVLAVPVSNFLMLL
jgi:predicted AAA+ superfamily ATPase